jgi:P-type Ca2+ transporter type 2C
MTSLTKAPPDQKPIWHTLSTDDALRDQGVAAATGLSQAEVSKRLQQYGTNRFAAAKKEPGWRTFLRQYRDPCRSSW